MRKFSWERPPRASRLDGSWGRQARPWEAGATHRPSPHKWGDVSFAWVPVPLELGSLQLCTHQIEDNPASGINLLTNCDSPGTAIKRLPGKLRRHHSPALLPPGFPCDCPDNQAAWATTNRGGHCSDCPLCSCSYNPTVITC